MSIDGFLVSLLAQAPAAAAVIVVVIKFLAFLKSEREERRRTYDARHTEFFRELERGRQLAESIRQTVEENAKQTASNMVVMEQTCTLLRSLNST